MNMESRIQALRKLKNLTQGELSELTKIPLRTINKVENGKGDLSTEQLKNLSIFFEVSADYLLTGSEEPTGISKEEKEIIEVLRGDRDMTNAVMEFAKIKKKAISFTRSYAAASQSAVMS